jgi:hypothetical protein
MIDKVLRVLNIRKLNQNEKKKKYFSLRLFVTCITRFGLSPALSGHSTFSRIETRL